ncbi:type I restriction enzyme S subunit [Isoptericola jiangsuensis]|uniref:Type I restriction enzyme S subunit n=1 Tax=Isoptericola jiangsuensis TaxID=548579 RepID=A0A2A9EXC4_9MICO|nr:restriction endonuclease subunit S [Isoptericola jiangsuensis]PFG43797.1 type I restriction enzyme S subunit [Isoptericola jiangsuensis]
MPAGWRVVPAKGAFIERREKSGPDDVHLTPSQSYGVLPQNEYMRITGNRVVLNLEGQDNMKHVEPDDFVIHLRSFQGGIEWSGVAGKVSMAYTVLTPRNHEVVPEFFRWVLKSEGYIQEIRSTTDQLRDGQSIKYSTFAKVPLPLPPVDEQRRIADFLDAETAEIDTLIAEQERFIDLLRERRDAVVSRAVETGPLVASLGLVLEGMKDGTHGSFERTGPEGGFPLLGARNVMGSQVVIDGAESYISQADHDSIVSNGYPRRGDVLLVIVGATIGKTAVHERDERLSFQRSVAFLRPAEALDPYYLWLQIQGRKFQDELRLRAKVSAQPGIYLGDVAGIPVHVPALEEQQEIVGLVRAQTQRIDRLMDEAAHNIALSKERRSALITAAVTGQIGVSAGRAG